jgi:hypothetical protein
MATHVKLLDFFKYLRTYNVLLCEWTHTVRSFFSQIKLNNLIKKSRTIKRNRWAFERLYWGQTDGNMLRYYPYAMVTRRFVSLLAVLCGGGRRSGIVAAVHVVLRFVLLQFHLFLLIIFCFFWRSSRKSQEGRSGTQQRQRTTTAGCQSPGAGVLLRHLL